MRAAANSILLVPMAAIAPLIIFIPITHHYTPVESKVNWTCLAAIPAIPARPSGAAPLYLPLCSPLFSYPYPLPLRSPQLSGNSGQLLHIVQQPDNSRCCWDLSARGYHIPPTIPLPHAAASPLTPLNR